MNINLDNVCLFMVVICTIFAVISMSISSTIFCLFIIFEYCFMVLQILNYFQERNKYKERLKHE